jgi:hypothetical protein
MGVKKSPRRTTKISGLSANTTDGTLNIGAAQERRRLVLIRSHECQSFCGVTNGLQIGWGEALHEAGENSRI